ncbi:MAG: hypothetical protein HY673_13190 [Chloroflexi bacterium]|nr:hypothetical protein [Chloroflexota bacterium]
MKFDGEPAYVEHRQKMHGEQLQVKQNCCGMKFYTDEGYAEHGKNMHGGQAAERKGFLARLFKK